MDLLAARTRRAAPAFLAALALGVTACGEKDVESGVSQGADKAEKAGKDAASKASKEAKKAKKDAER